MQCKRDLIMQKQKLKKNLIHLEKKEQKEKKPSRLYHQKNQTKIAQN